MTSTAPVPLLVDRFAAPSDFTRTAHVLVDAPPATVFRAVRALDLAQLRHPVLDAAKAVRRLPARLRGRKHRRPSRRTIADLTAGTDWVLLGERPDTEVVFGAVGRFWRPVVELREVEGRDFADFAEPGYGKVVCSLAVSPYGGRRSVLTYELRVALDDPESWVRFRRYWRVARPFLGLMERVVLRAVKQAAERDAVR
ncbi:hypothetical protein GCM10010492_58830 [Saccharothrix mutabilis subsp. mutabilis]|uniref:Uncharacterized protein n=1 Tax=Saccharothrix mutabilis subsp. mutabilis TaxID=66855 RepID=A0ABP3E5L1_9PSEU